MSPNRPTIVSPLEDIVETQRKLNCFSDRAWGSFADHRKRVTELILAQGQGERLCILGAGNCNDIDVLALLGSFRTIHLVDIDGEALRRGLARQRLTAVDSIKVHELDLSGVIQMMRTWTPATPISQNALIACRDQPTEQMRTSLPYEFDVVASTCVLSQLIVPIVDTLGEQNPHFLPVIQAVRLGHLRLMVRLAKPGGIGVLITDVVSSETYPSLKKTTAQALPGVLTQLIREQNFFHGLNPAVLLSILQTDPILRSSVASVETRAPWLWRLVDRWYAVCGIVLRTKVDDFSGNVGRAAVRR